MNNSDQPQIQTSSNSVSAYENNPLFVATNGLDLLFKKALSIGIVFAVLSAISVLGGIPSSFAPAANKAPTEVPVNAPAGSDPASFINAITNVPLEMWLFIGLIALAVSALVVVILIAVQGIADVTAAHLARGETINITEALREVFQNFWGYFWVIFIMDVKIFLWALLFLIPGFIMAVRYSLSGVVYFDKKLKGNASVKESSRLVKGAWLTTFASKSLLNILTLGFIDPLLSPGTNAVLYRQLTTTPETRPKAHIFSWLTLIVPIVLAFLVLALMVGAVINFQNAL